MKSRLTVIVVLIGLVIALPNITPALAQVPLGNLVHAELTHGNWYFTDEDSMSLFEKTDFRDGGICILRAIEASITDLVSLQG